MKKRLVKSARILIFLGIGWVVSCFMLTAVLNSSFTQQFLLNYLQTSTQMRVVVDGAVDFEVLPHPRVRVEQLRVYLTKDLKASEFIRLGKADLELKLWPLFRNQWVLRQVKLEDWSINLETDAQGHQLWKTTSSTNSQPTSTDEVDWFSHHFFIEQITVRQGNLHFVDQQRQRDLQLEDLTLHMTDLRWGEQAKIELASKIHFAAQSWDIAGQAKVFFDALQFKLTDLDIQLVTQNGSAQADFRLPSLIYERSSQIIQASVMQLQSPPLLLQLNFAGTGNADALNLQGRVVLEKFNLSSWLALWGFHVVEPQNLITLQQLGLDFNWHLTPARLEVQDLNLLIDQSRVQANIGFQRDLPAELKFTVQLDQLDLAHYLPKNSNAAPLVSIADFLQRSAPAASMVSQLQALPVNGKLAIHSLKWGELAMQNVVLDLTAHSDQFTVHPSISGVSKP